MFCSSCLVHSFSNKMAEMEKRMWFISTYKSLVGSKADLCGELSGNATSQPFLQKYPIFLTT